MKIGDLVRYNDSPDIAVDRKKLSPELGIITKTDPGMPKRCQIRFRLKFSRSRFVSPVKCLRLEIRLPCKRSNSSLVRPTSGFRSTMSLSFNDSAVNPDRPDIAN